MIKKERVQKETEILAQQLKHQKELSDAKDKQLESFRAEMKEAAEKQEKINEGLVAKQIQAMEAQKAAENAEVNKLQDRMADLQRIVELSKTDKEEAAKQGKRLSAQIAKLEQERLDWKKAEEEKMEKLMKDTPPPFALKKNPPKNKPLYSEDYPCFAVMGRNGTGKSSLINMLTGAKPGVPQYRPPGSLVETTMGEPAPVFMKTPTGTMIALFDRPGHGAKATAAAGSAPNFIAEQGLKWWTGVILLTDRASVPEETVMFQLCQSINTPILVARNKIAEDLGKEKEEKAFTGEEFTEENAITQIRAHLDEISIDGKAAKMIDTKHPEKYQFNEVVEWIEKLSKKV